MLKAIVFDLGGTLIEYAGPYASWPDLETPGVTAAYDYLEAEGIALPALEEVQNTAFALLPHRWQAAVRGEQNLQLAQFMGEVLAACETPPVDAGILREAAAQYERAICAQAQPMPAAQETLAQLKEAGYKLGLISNTMFTGQAHQSDLARFGLDGYFDAMLFSADENKWKPNAETFIHLLEKLTVAPETAVYIGDDPASDVVGGQQAGMRTIHIRSSQRFPTPEGVKPHATIHALMELPDVLDAWANGLGSVNRSQ